MTEATPGAAPAGGSAGAILRAARERQGIHIAVLAAAIKISPRKLDALEGDRFDELPDATFTRALAQTVCRALKIDAAPVMALLPAAAPKSLDAVSDGLNTPFKDKSAGDLAAILPRAPLVWAALALLAAAALVMYWPSRSPEARRAAETATEAPAAASAATVTTTTELALPAASAPPVLPSLSAASGADFASAAALPAATASSALGAVPDSAARPPSLPPVTLPTGSGAAIAVSEPVWLEVIDGTGQVVFQRTVQPGETVNFDQKPPLKLKIGNAAAARLSFRGEPVDLAPVTRSNVARVELK